jgi:LacI family transcriptional regulator
MKHKRTNLSDIAKKAGISKSAVSLALNGSTMVSEATRKKVEQIAKAMGYERNALVSSMMSSLKREGSSKYSETIALVNGNIDEFALKNHPTLPKYCEGIKDEANRLGYTINEFWLHDSNLNGEQFSRILHSRGIRGGIILGHSFGTVFPKSFENIWQNFYFISAGIKTQQPQLEMVSADHYAITYQAVLKALELGYKRPALVIEENIDNLVDGRFVAGFLRAQMRLSIKQHIPPFLKTDTHPNYDNELEKWINTYNPDVLLYLLNTTRETLLAKIQKQKKPIKLIQLERRSILQNWIGMEQNNDTVGRIAMRRLADMLSRTSAVVGENSNLVTLVPPTWISE